MLAVLLATDCIEAYLVVARIENIVVDTNLTQDLLLFHIEHFQKKLEEATGKLADAPAFFHKKNDR